MRDEDETWIEQDLWMDGWLSVFDGVKCCIREGRNGGREGAGDMRAGFSGMIVGL